MSFSYLWTGLKRLDVQLVIFIVLVTSGLITPGLAGNVLCGLGFGVALVVLFPAMMRHLWHGSLTKKG